MPENNNLALKLKIFFKYVIRIFLNLIYIISYLSPRNNKIWIFGDSSSIRFSDNAKYLFLYVANNKNDIKAVWISKNKEVINTLNKKGYKAFHYLSLKGIFYTLVGKYFITDSYASGINYWLSGNAKKISLWHGIPLKKMGYDTEIHEQGKYFKSKGIKRFFYKIIFPWFFDDKYITVTSDLFQNIFMSIFQAPKENVIVTGYPRNDIFFQNSTNSNMGSNVISKIQKIKSNKKKIILYLPTFRDSGGNPLTDAKFDYNKLNDFLSQNNVVFITKLHILTKMNKDVIKDLNTGSFSLLPPETDIYPILSYIDILITDYSSIYFDYLLLNKPVVFFPYDIKKYINKDRELYFDYNKFTPGPKANNFTELLGHLKHILVNNDNYAEQRNKIKNVCFKYQDGNSSERIYKFLYKLTNN